MNVQLKGYVRCSSKEQNPERQIIAMREFGVPEEAIVIEMLSGKNFERPIYQEMVRQLKPGDVLVLNSLDRLGRDYDAVIDEWRYVTKELGADIVILDMPLLDTRQKDRDLTAAFIADIVLQILSYVAEMEREFNRQRQAEGIAAAKARGVKLGRPPKERPTLLKPISKLWQSGEISAREAARRLGIAPRTFINWAKAEGMVN